MTVEFDLTEVDGIAHLILAAPALANEAAYRAAQKVGHEVKRRAQAAAPRDRPWLATDGIRMKSWRFAIGSHVDVYTTPDPEGRPVGFFVEYGTADTPPNPFLSSQMAWAADKFHEAVLAAIDPLKEP